MSIQCSKKCFSIQTKSTLFTVQWPALVLFVAITALFAYLSHWQYTRYIDQKKTAKVWIENQHKPTLMVNSHNAIDVSNNHRNIQISGFFVPKKNVFVDNALYHHSPGYQVVTPFEMVGSKTWILVNRGWIPYASESHREQIPYLPDVIGPQSLKGQLYCPQKRPFLLNKRAWAAHGEKSSSIVAQTLDLPRIKTALDHDIHACYLRLTSPKEVSFMLEWYTTPMTPYRHLGYAFQWLLFASIFWIIFYLKHRERKT